MPSPVVALTPRRVMAFPPFGPVHPKNTRATLAAKEGASYSSSSTSPQVSPLSRSTARNETRPGPSTLGLRITMYYVIEERVGLQSPNRDGDIRLGWWLQAMMYSYACFAPPPPRAVPASGL